jgi:hypothetical protein
VGQKVLLYSEYCKHCDEARAVLRKDLIDGKILLVNVDRNKDGKAIASAFGGVPTLVEIDNGQIHELVLF